MKKYVKSSSITNPDSDLYGFVDETIFDIKHKWSEVHSNSDFYEDDPKLYKIAQKVENILDSCYKDLSDCLDIDFNNYYMNKEGNIL